MKVYIAGPINGYPDGNRESFAKVAQELRNIGHEPVNPHDIGPAEHAPGAHSGAPVDHSDHGYGCFMAPDLRALLKCDAFTLLPGWVRSKGACVERDVANICGKAYIVVPGSMPSEGAS